MSYHLTSQEKSRLIHEEKRRRRIARLVQVRTQMANNAEQIRETVLSEKITKLNKIKADLRRAVVTKMCEINSKPTKNNLKPVKDNSIKTSSSLHRTHLNTVSFRLTIQERKRLIDDERRKRRIARLLQVRAQMMSNTKEIRKNVLSEDREANND